MKEHYTYDENQLHILDKASPPFLEEADEPSLQTKKSYKRIIFISAASVLICIALFIVVKFILHNNRPRSMEETIRAYLDARFQNRIDEQFVDLCLAKPFYEAINVESGLTKSDLAEMYSIELDFATPIYLYEDVISGYELDLEDIYQLNIEDVEKEFRNRYGVEKIDISDAKTVHPIVKTTVARGYAVTVYRYKGNWYIYDKMMAKYSTTFSDAYYEFTNDLYENNFDNLVSKSIPHDGIANLREHGRATESIMQAVLKKFMISPAYQDTILVVQKKLRVTVDSELRGLRELISEEYMIPKDDISEVNVTTMEIKYNYYADSTARLNSIDYDVIFYKYKSLWYVFRITTDN